jgi:hypothetical protein
MSFEHENKQAASMAASLIKCIPGNRYWNWTTDFCLDTTPKHEPVNDADCGRLSTTAHHHASKASVHKWHAWVRLELQSSGPHHVLYHQLHAFDLHIKCSRTAVACTNVGIQSPVTLAMSCIMSVLPQKLRAWVEAVCDLQLRHAADAHR